MQRDERPQAISRSERRSRSRSSKKTRRPAAQMYRRAGSRVSCRPSRWQRSAATIDARKEERRRPQSLRRPGAKPVLNRTLAVARQRMSECYDRGDGRCGVELGEMTPPPERRCRRCSEIFQRDGRYHEDADDCTRRSRRVVEQRRTYPARHASREYAGRVATPRVARECAEPPRKRYAAHGAGSIGSALVPYARPRPRPARQLVEKRFARRCRKRPRPGTSTIAISGIGHQQDA